MNRIECLESRVFLAGNVEAGLVDGLLTLTGDAEANGITVSERLERVAGLAQVKGGTTNFSFDAAALEAAGLKISSIRSPIRPILPATTGPTVMPPPNVGVFPILRTSDFVYKTPSQEPVSGVIKHAGSVGFNEETLIMGNFAIGYDASRIPVITVIGGPSGYYVFSRTSTGDKQIFFDISSTSDPALSTASSVRFLVKGNLLVAPELAEKLEKPEAAGDDVGDARINALSAPVMRPAVVVTGMLAGSGVTTVNGKRQVSFPAGDVESLSMDLAAGNDRAALVGLRLDGDLNLGTGEGNDALFLSFVATKGNLTAKMGAGNDLLSIVGTNVVGAGVLDGGEDTDRLILLGSRFGTQEILNFEGQVPPPSTILPPPPPPPGPAPMGR